MSKYDDNFLVDYIDKRIKIKCNRERMEEVYTLLYNNCRKATIDYHPVSLFDFITIRFDVRFRKTDTDEFIKIAELVHNEYRRICGYQKVGKK